MSDVQRGSVYESRDPREPGRRVRVVDIDPAPQKGGNGCIAKGPVAVVEPVTGGRQTRIAVWRLASSRWAPVALAALMFGCDDVPSEGARRACGRMDPPHRAVCNGNRDLPDGSCAFNCVPLVERAEAGADAATDGGAWDFGAGLERLPMEPARWTR